MCVFSRVVLLLLCVPTLLLADFEVSLNDDDRFVLHAVDQPLQSLSFLSPSNNLTPATSAAPFQSLISNRPGNIEYFNRQPVTLDGSITLTSGVKDRSAPVNINYAGAGITVFPLRLSPPCTPDCPNPLMEVTLNDDSRFVLHGDNHVIASLDFHSNGSLLPAADAGPFSSLSSNTPQHIGFNGGAAGVTIDGAVTLSAGWDANGTIGDVRYEYTEAGGQRTGTLVVPDDVYPHGHLDANINDFNQVVLTGRNQKVSSLEFSSRSGSLVPGTSSAPFDTMTASNESAVFSQSEGNLTLDGEVTLDLEWNPEGRQDVQFRFEGAGNAPNGGYFLSRGNYPAATGERPSLWLSLDEDFEIILHAQEPIFIGLDIHSADGALIPADSPSPFQLFLANHPRNVAVANLGGAVDVDGSVKTEIGFNPLLGASELTVNYGTDARIRSFEVLPSDLALCPGCENPTIGIDSSGQFEIAGFETELTRVTMTSASGALTALNTEEGPWALVESSEEEILLTVRDAEVDAFSALDLPIAWSSFGTQDVFVTFTTISGAQIGPFPLPEASYTPAVPEPQSVVILGLGLALLASLRSRRSVFGGCRR